MSTEAIKSVLDSGECPVCGANINPNEDMTGYFCSKDRSHFDLQLTFHGGEKMTAKLNGEPVPQDQLEDIEW